MKDHILLYSALLALHIDTPILRYEIAVQTQNIASPTITLYLQNGQVHTWTPGADGVEAHNMRPPPTHLAQDIRHLNPNRAKRGYNHKRKSSIVNRKS
jgi:hypothetical protein